MCRTTSTVAVWLAASLFALPAPGGEIRGVVQVIDGLTKKRVTLPAYQSRGLAAPEPAAGPIDELTRVVVYLEGSIGQIKPVAGEIRQRDRRFEPEILAVPRGSTVSFPNSDPILHNVFSLSKLKSFDLGYYPVGNTRIVHFDQPGAIQVYCHLHSDMSALILVTPNQFYAQPSNSGAFKFAGLRAGSYTVVAWHKSAGFSRKKIEVPEDGVAEVVFEIPVVGSSAVRQERGAAK
jgi:plastocyanin